MSYTTFKEIPLDKTGEIDCALIDCQSAKTAAGKEYAILTLLDGKEKISAKDWEHTAEQILAVYDKESVVHATLSKQLYNKSESYVLRAMSKSTEITIEQFAVKAPVDPSTAYNEILNKIHKECGDTPLFQLTKTLYEENKEKLLKWGAAKTVHHDFRGGLLYHTLRMVYSASSLAKVYYRIIDKDLLMNAAALHDIGKLEELSTDELGASDYTIDGTLFSHLSIGSRMIDEEYRKHPDQYPEEKVKLLMHCVESHHGQREFGAIVLPAIPEAVLLHNIDDMDAKINIFEKAFENMEPGTRSAREVFGLDTRIYKDTEKGNLKGKTAN